MIMSNSELIVLSLTPPRLKLIFSYHVLLKRDAKNIAAKDLESQNTGERTLLQSGSNATVTIDQRGEKLQMSSSSNIRSPHRIEFCADYDRK